MVAAPADPKTLATCIVAFEPDLPWLRRTLQSLHAALLRAMDEGVLSTAEVTVVDNSAPGATSPLGALLDELFSEAPDTIRRRCLAGQGNVGYGRANNLAYQSGLRSEFLLTLNPDVELDAAALANGLRFLLAERACCMVTPVARAPDGAPLYLVKNYPRVWVLGVRGFAPEYLKRLLSRRLSVYERADRPYDSPLSDARIVSGCFMLMRRETFERVQGFDESFFLYFEDFDLSFRMSEVAVIVRLADCRIVHAGGQASRKGWPHVRLFMRSAARFFGKHGWR